MCTVTFIPANGRYYITSNRDEKYVRKKAIFPQAYLVGNSMLVYPKDPDGGGSWIAVNNNRNAAVLLNGAFTKHTPMPPYAKSRGLVFIDIIASDKPVMYFLGTKLLHIEPFTIIITEEDSLYECRWDGHKKYCRQLTKNKPYIWSSATLYSEDIKQKREHWFNNWLNNNSNPGQAEIIEFHMFGGDGDSTNDLIMNRDNQMLTVSITSIELAPGNATIAYNDLQECKNYKYRHAFMSAPGTRHFLPAKSSLIF